MEKINSDQNSKDHQAHTDSQLSVGESGSGRSFPPPPFQLKAGSGGALENSESANLVEATVLPKPSLVSPSPSPIQCIWGMVDGSNQNLNLLNLKKTDSTGRNLYMLSQTEEIYVEVSSRGGLVVELQGDDSDEEMSDLDSFMSEDDSDFEGIESVRVRGNRKIDKDHHVSNSIGRFDKTTISTLESHATAVHKAGGGDGRLTIVCGQFLTKDGDYIRVVTANTGLMPPGARSYAESLGYVVIRGVKSHAEANLQIYAEKHSSDLQYAGHGCDKAACKQCEENMTDTYGDVDFGSQGTTNKYTKTYFNQGISDLKSDRLDDLQFNINSNYGMDGKLI